MAASYYSPGVYREEIFVRPAAVLPTGIPGFVGLAQVQDPATATPALLHRKEEFANVFASPDNSYLAAAVTGFFENGGSRCYLAPADPQADAHSALLQALETLGPVQDLDLVAVPDAMLLSGTAAVAVQQATLSHCNRHGNRLAILDALRGSATEAVLAQRDRIVLGQTEPLNGALYYPWLQTTAGRWTPPCGHVAGIFARSDNRVGVFKAPANEEMQDILDLELVIDNQVQNQLNPEGVNCLRAFPGRGIRVWGARTLNRDPDWRYINVRRLFLTVQRWIDRNMIWAAFEPNDPRLWVRIQRELTTYLTGWWRAGALQGQTPTEGCYVRCDADTNPPETRELGQVITELGLAVSAPAEFVVVRIIHRAGTTATV